MIQFCIRPNKFNVGEKQKNPKPPSFQSLKGRLMNSSYFAFKVTDDFWQQKSRGN